MPNRAGYNPLGQPPYVALIIEDDFVAKSVLTLYLVSLGFKIMDTSTLSGAYELLGSVIPDVIFLDRILFNRDGMELLRKRQDDAHLQKIRTIVTTGEKGLQSITDTLNLGADDYIIKPIDKDILTQALMKLGFQLTENLLTKPKINHKV
jgi:response regulator of citrate/malate metabolism